MDISNAISIQGSFPNWEFELNIFAELKVERFI